MRLARLLQGRLERGCTVHGIRLEPSPTLFTEARREVECLTAADAQLIAEALIAEAYNKPGNAPRLGLAGHHGHHACGHHGHHGLTPAVNSAVASLMRQGDTLVQSAQYTEAAAVYAEAQALHPANQLLPKLVKKAHDATADIGHVAALLATHDAQPMLAPPPWP